MVLHSSGTTSTPKGIAHSNNTLRYATEGICKRWELTGEDIYLVVCEFGFVGGWCSATFRRCSTARRGSSSTAGTPRTPCG